jgi:uncharacterized protein YbjT (DUF2867 family)
MYAPTGVTKDGIYVFGSAIGDGHIPMIALPDIGFWARYSFDHRKETSGKDLEVVSQMVTPDMIVEAFTKVTGLPAVHKRQTIDEWWGNFNGVDEPIASERQVLYIRQ